MRAFAPLAVTLPAHLGAVPAARHELTRWLEATPVPPGITEELALVVTELVTNAVEASPSAPTQILIWAQLEPHRVVLRVCDEGDGFAVTPVTPTLPDETSVRGRGLPIVTALMDEFTVNRRHGRTEVEVTRRLPPR